jgi:hypothetical protein
MGDLPVEMLFADLHLREAYLSLSYEMQILMQAMWQALLSTCSVIAPR